MVALAGLSSDGDPMSGAVLAADSPSRDIWTQDPRGRWQDFVRLPSAELRNVALPVLSLPGRWGRRAARGPG